MIAYGIPPDWLAAPAAAVLDDLQGAQPIRGLQLVATVMDSDFNGLSLGLLEPSRARGDLLQLPDDLDPDQPPVTSAGGNWVPRTMVEPELLRHIADLLQEELAETSEAWGQSRPLCPEHPHPLRAVVHGDEAWWICERDDRLLYRIGRREVPTRLRPPPSWDRTESRRARKRRHR